MTAPWVKRLTDAAVVSPLGLCGKVSHISDFSSGSNLSYKAAMKDRFIIRVPYAGDSLSWTVLFNAQHDHHAPDFVFNDSPEFEPRLDLLPLCALAAEERGVVQSFELTELKTELRPLLQHPHSEVPLQRQDETTLCKEAGFISLLNWDTTDNHSLRKVVSELYSEYKHYQRSVLKDTPSLWESYLLLIQSGVVKEENVEINHFYSQGQKTPNSIVFIIKLDLPFDRIPEELAKVSGPDLAILKIVYNLQTYKLLPSVGLKLSPRLSQAFGSSLQIPDFPAEGHLVEYVADLLEYLQEMIETIDSGMSKRVAYIEQLHYLFKGSVLEYDDKDYSSANLLMNYLDFHFIIHISLPQYFPAEQPRLTLSSIYHSDENDLPFSKTTKSYPWNPRWTPTEMANRLREYLLQVIPSFQRNSVHHGVSLQSDHNQENTTSEQQNDGQGPPS